MSQQRYHIHVCLVKNEQPDFENALQIAIADSYFLTWDLQGISPQKTFYTRQQIDRCDYVLFVIGDEYGELSPSGVGYLHLSYVYAVTKRKPIFAVIKNPATTIQHQRQQLEFTQLIQKDQISQIAEYRQSDEAIPHILKGLKNLIQVFPCPAWCKSDDEVYKSTDFLFTPKAVSQNTKKVTPISLPAEEKIEPIAELLPSQSSAISLLPNDTLALNDTVLVSYTTHAYQDGNLSELTLTHSFSWQDILQSLSELPISFSMESVSKKVNETLSKFALEEAIKIIPNAHAVSRTQINALDFNWIRKQLLTHHLLVKIPNQASSKVLWQLNPQLKIV